MNRERVKEVLDRVLTWSPDRQEDAAAVLLGIEAQDESLLRLSEDQLAEVRHRRAATSSKKLTLAEFDERLRRFGI